MSTILLCLLFFSFINQSRSERKMSPEPTIETVSVEPPVNSSLPNRNNWLVVRAATNLTLECYATQPVTWNYVEKTIYYKHLFRNEPYITREVLQVVNPVDQSPVDGVRLFVSRIQLVLESVNDTRKITCSTGNNSGWNLVWGTDRGEVPVEEEENESERREASILIFVFDGKNLLVPLTSSSPTRVVVTGMKTTVPCRPTHPRTVITLFNINNINKPFPVARSHAIKGGRAKVKFRQEFKFDPSRGFDVEDIGAFLNGSFLCRAQLGERISNNPIKYSLREEKQPKARIVGPRSDWLTGESLTLDCIGEIEIRTSLTFNWILPSNQSFPDRMSRGIQEKHSTFGTEVKSSLLLRDLKPQDSGFYTCTVHDTHSIGKKMESATFSVKVHEKPFVNLVARPEMYIQLVSPKKDKVQFRAEVHACPIPALKWFKNNAPLVDDFRIVARDNELTIFNPNPSDTGLYKLQATASEVTSSLLFNLTVKVPPINRITNQEQVYQLNSTYSLLCQFDGVPLPDVWWSWSPCSDLATCSDPPPADHGRWVYPQKTSNFLSEPVYGSHVSNLTVVAKETGFYLCQARNSEGLHWASYLFIVSDIPGGLGIVKDTPAESVVGDRVKLSCWTNSITFEPASVKWLFRDPSTESDYHEVIERREIKLENETGTKHSSILSMTFTSVDFMDDTSYVCSALRHQLRHRGQNGSSARGETTFDTYRLKVLPLEFPWFESSISENTVTHLNSTFVMTCKAFGRPSPVLEWFKDGQPIIEFKGNAFQNDPTNKDRYQLKEGGTTLSVTSVTSKEEGVYECRASNKAGTASRSTKLVVVDALSVQSSVTEQNHRRVKLVAIATSLTFGVTLIVTLICCCVTCRKLKELRRVANLKHLEKMLVSPPTNMRYNPDVPLDEQTDLLTYDQSVWEVDLERVEFCALLGRGAFGQVYKARMRGDRMKTKLVAVKTVRDSGDVQQLKSLISELKVLIHLGCHDNVLKVIGAVTKDIRKGNLYLITEYCRFGSLKSFLLLHGQKSWSGNGKPKNQHKEQLSSGPCHDVMRLLRTSLVTNELYGNEIPSVDRAKRVEFVDFGKVKFTNESSDDGLESKSFLQDFFRLTDDSCVTDGLKEKLKENSVLPVLEQEKLDVDNENIENDIKLNKNCDEDDDDDGDDDDDVGEWEELTKNHLYDFALQIARGLEYLSSKKYIHRDLAARNILVSSKKVLKICDFGLAKGCYRNMEYQKKSDTPVPVKWMALESLTQNVYSLQSDIWSFGVLLWEIFSLGLSPYPGENFDKCFVDKLERGFRLDKPEAADDHIYDLMMACWVKYPEHRPTASQLVQFIAAIIANMHNPTMNIGSKDGLSHPQSNLPKDRNCQSLDQKFYQNESLPGDPGDYENDSGAIPYVVTSSGKTSISFQSRTSSEYKRPDNPYLSPNFTPENQLVIIDNHLYDLPKVNLERSGSDSAPATLSSAEENDVFEEEEEDDDFEVKNHLGDGDTGKRTRKASCTLKTPAGEKGIRCSADQMRKTDSFKCPNPRFCGRKQKMSTESGIYSMGSKNSLPKNDKMVRSPSCDGELELDEGRAKRRHKSTSNSSAEEAEPFLKKEQEVTCNVESCKLTFDRREVGI